MSLTPEQVQAANLRNARSGGGCMGAMSALIFCFTLGWMIWEFANSGFNLWGGQGPEKHGWPTPILVGFWVMVAAVTLTGIWAGRSAGPELLPPDSGLMVVPAGILMGLAMEVVFWLCLFGASQWDEGGWYGWLTVLGRALYASLFGAILAVPWGIATAGMIRSSLQPQKRAAKRERDFRHPSGGESLEE